MKWASSISESDSVNTAVEECAESIKGTIGDDPNLVFIFPSYNFTSHFVEISNAVNQQFRNSILIGCSGNGGIGSGQEVEQRP